MSSLTSIQLGVKSDRVVPPCPVLIPKRKKPGGGFLPDTPEERFYIVESMEDKSGRRPEHPAYAFFNKCTDPRIVSKLPCTLGGARREDVEELSRNFYRWDAKTLGKPPKSYHAPPHHRGSFCSTQSAEQDGVTVMARRWNGAEYADMECPGDRCEFSIPQKEGTRPPCLKAGRIWFHPRWDALAAMVEADLPAAAAALRRFPDSPLRLATGGQYAASLKSWDGFMAFVRSQLEALGVWPTPLHGLPFWLSVHLRSGDVVETPNGPRKRRYTVYDFEPAGDISTWLVAQAEWRNRLLAGTVSLIGPGSPAEALPETVAADIREISDGDVVETRPARVAAVEKAPDPEPEPERDLLAEIKAARKAAKVKIRDWWKIWQEAGKEPDPARMDDKGRAELLAWIVERGKAPTEEKPTADPKTIAKVLAAANIAEAELRGFVEQVKGSSLDQMTLAEVLAVVEELAAVKGAEA